MNPRAWERSEVVWIYAPYFFSAGHSHNGENGSSPGGRGAGVCRGGGTGRGIGTGTGSGPGPGPRHSQWPGVTISRLWTHVHPAGETSTCRVRVS